MARSQTATVWSSEPVTTCRPSGLTATARHRTLVPGELAEPLAGGEVPDRHGAGRRSRRRRAGRRGSPPRTSPHPWCPASTRSRSPVARSQTATVPSSEPETTCRPSGLTATARHRTSVPGELAEPLAGGEVPDRHGAVVGAGDDVPAVGAHRHGRHRTLVPGELAEPLPVARSQTATVWSEEPVTTCRPSGLTATAVTAS